MICHHCDFRQPIPENCPQCQSTKLTHHGAGTEQIEGYLNTVFPEFTCIRIDRDSTSRKGAFQKQMDRAHSESACILVGTQMLAKGHHLPRLSLAVVCDADQGLFSHDFRAKEHLAQLITQVAGRTGRVNKRGELIIESGFVEHPFWEALTKDSHSEFAAELISERKAQKLPPYAHSASLRAECTDFNLLLRFMNTARKACTPHQEEVDIVGPIPSILERRNNRYRYQINFMSPSRRQLHQMLSQLTSELKSLRQVSQVRWAIDVDPQTLD